MAPSKLIENKHKQKFANAIANVLANYSIVKDSNADLTVGN